MAPSNFGMTNGEWTMTERYPPFTFFHFYPQGRGHQSDREG